MGGEAKTRDEPPFSYFHRYLATKSGFYKPGTTSLMMVLAQAGEGPNEG